MIPHRAHLDTDRSIGVAACIIVGVITGGLLADQNIEFWGQTLTNLPVWSLLLYWLWRANAMTQVALVACVIYATLGEIFLSLAWGLYDYRLNDIPMFFPSGYALLFMLGATTARRMKDWVIWRVAVSAVPAHEASVASGSPPRSDTSRYHVVESI